MLKLAYFLRNLQNSRANNPRILRIEKIKFSRYCFYLNTNIQGDCQIYISVPLISYTGTFRNMTAFNKLCLQKQPPRVALRNSCSAIFRKNRGGSYSLIGSKYGRTVLHHYFLARIFRKSSY